MLDQPFTGETANNSFESPTDPNLQSTDNQKASGSYQTEPSAAEPGGSNGAMTTVNKIYSFTILGLLFLLPLLVIPFTNNFISQTKLLLVFAGALITGGFFLYNSFKNKGWKFVLSPLTLPLVLFGLTALGSALLTQNYPVSNLLGIGGAYIALALIPLLGGALGDKESTKWVVPTISISAAVLTLSSLLQLLGYGPTQLINAVTGFNLQHSLIFNLAGSSLVAAQFIFIALVGTIVQVVKGKKITALHTITIPILVLGLGLHLWSLLPGQDAQMVLTPLSASWSVALDSLRAPRTALIGHGPAHYADIFSRYRPTWLNGTEFWQMGFNSGFGLPMTMIVQLGVLGLAAWVFLLIKFFKNKDDADVEFKNNPITWMIGASFLMQIFLAPSTMLLGLQAFLILFWIISFKDEFSTVRLKALSASVDGGKKGASSRNEVNRWITLGTTGLLAAGLFFLTYLVGKSWAGYHQAYLASQSYTENDAVGVYEHQRQAVILNPYLDNHRRTYALTNLDIAIALSNKADVTDQEQQQIAQLISQSVREGRAATTINPLSSNNWAALAQIYQELIGSTEEADQWAISAYIEAISADPTNPMLRMRLGNVLMNQEQVQQAINVYNQAVNLKPDLPVAYFNLGAALAQNNQLEAAQQAWERALTLLDPESEDYQIVSQSLEQIEQQIEAGETAAGQQAGQQAETDQQQETPLSEQLNLTEQNLQEPGEQTVAPGDDLQNVDLEQNPDLINEEDLDEEAIDTQEEDQTPTPTDE